MTTRRYIQNAPPSFTPAIGGTDWNDTAANVWKKLAATKAGAAATVAQAETSTSNTWDIALLTAVIDITQSGTLTSGDTVLIRVGRLANALNFFQLACYAWVSTGASNTKRATVLAHFVSGVYWTVSAAFTGFTMTIGSNVAVTAGDKLIFEFGARAVNTSATSRTATLYYGGTDPDSQPPSGAPTDTPLTPAVGWLDFTGGIESLIIEQPPSPPGNRSTRQMRPRVTRHCHRADAGARS